jgi:hypothetical protein
MGVSRERGNRLVCYCDDCQAYARHLGGDGIVDAQGGTDIFQLTPAQIRLAADREPLRCLRLTEKGLLRWYAGCCRTPVANTLASPRVPFAGLVHTFMDFASGTSRDEVLGPPLARIHGRFVASGVPPGAHATAPPWLVLRSARLLLGAWIRGKSRPHPFFDATTGAPVVAPQVLTPAQREELRS